jgi:ABC-type spermidine/putrescine transport system permease subunit I
MLGNLIDDAVSQSGRGPEAGSLTIILMLIVVVPMFYYLRETRRQAERA